MSKSKPSVGKHDIFVSYSHKDKTRVHAICDCLRDKHNTVVWLDEWSILAGERISLSIEIGLKEAKILFLMLSPAALSSQWVDLEWRTKFEEEIEESHVAVACVLVESIEMSALPTFLKGKKHIRFDKDISVLAQQIADAANAHIERREELSNKAINRGTIELMKNSLENRGGGALHPIYQRVFNGSVFDSPDYTLRLKVLESELEAALVVQQRRTRSAKTHMDNMQVQSDGNSNAIPMFVATAGAIQSERDLDAVETTLVRVRNYVNMASADPEISIELWKDVLQLLRDATDTDYSDL